MQTSKTVPAKDEALSDLHGFVIIVTGGNSGIGYETSFQLALKGARVYLAARSQARIAEAIGKMKGSTQKQLDLRSLDLDLSSLSSVKAAADRFIGAESRLDVLINNAGVSILFYPSGLSIGGPQSSLVNKSSDPSPFHR